MGNYNIFRMSLTEVCSIGNTIFTDARCLDLPADTIIQLKKKYCNNPIMLGSDAEPDRVCRKFVREEGSGVMDSVLAQYCSNNLYKNDSLCSCINSPVYKESNYCPQMFDQTCIKKAGYLTNIMRTTKCPDVINCNSYVSYDKGSAAVGNTIIQNCAIDTNTGTATKETKRANLFDNISNTTLYIIIGVFIFMLITIISVIIALVIRNKHQIY